MENNVNINYDKVNSSSKVLASINELLKSVDLVSYFEDMESYFREINFEHANCLDYKESFDLIYNDIDSIKRRVDELQACLYNIDRTAAEVIAKSSDSKGDKKNGSFFKSLLSKINVDELDIKNPVPTQNQNTETVQQESVPINTVPIGVAIGAAGIIGAGGTIAINEMYDANRRKPKKRMEFNDYNVDETFNNDDDYKSMLTEDYFGNAGGFGDQTKPYVANRRARSADMSYFSDGEPSLPDYDDSDE